jgi:hypothetical protein
MRRNTINLPRLTDKQEVFIREMVLNNNAAEAARVAQYKGDSHGLAVQGHRLLQNPVIADAIEIKRQEVFDGLDLNVQWVLHKLRNVVTQFIDDPENAQHGLRAIEMIAKHLGMFIERKEVRGEITVKHTEVVKDYGPNGPPAIEGEHRVLELVSTNGHSGSD